MNTTLTAPSSNHPGFITGLLVTFAAMVAGSALSASAASIVNVNYTGDTHASMQGIWSFDAVARGSASRVAPVAYVGNTWNDFQTAGATGTNLLDSLGAPTGVGLTTTMVAGPWADWTGLGKARMLISGLLTGSTNYQPILTLTGLKVNHTYDLYLASDHSDMNRPQTFRVGTMEQHIANGPTAEDWIEGKNYVHFAGLRINDSGTLTVEGKTSSGSELIVNGFQLVDNDAPTPKSPAMDIMTFHFGTLGAAAISGTNITLNVLWGTAVTSLAPTYTLFPLASAMPPSGSTNDFTSPVIYTVTAEDSSTKAYRVVVNILPKSAAKDVLACHFEPLGAAIIYGTNIIMSVPASQPLTTLAPTFTLSPFAALRPAAGSTHDFTGPVNYTVTAQDGSTKAYRVTVRPYTAWKYSASLFILTTPDGAHLSDSASETNFPILVRLNNNNFNFSQAQPAGEDLRFSTAAGAKLSHQIEQWDAARGTASIWVKIPVIAGNARQEIKMYWGQAGAASESIVSNVFSAANGYVSVLHMNEPLQDELGTVIPVNSGTTPAPGMIGQGRHFASGSWVNCGDSITNYPYGGSPFTSEAWFCAEQGGAEILCWGRYATRYNGNTGDGNLVDIAFGSPASLGWSSDGPGGAIAATTPALGQWYHVAVTYANGLSRIFVNGRLDGDRQGGPSAMSLFTNIYMRMGGSRNYAGDVDEVRVSRVARSPDWLRLEYQNQQPLQTLVGPPQQPGTGFSVTPSAVKMNEGAVARLVGRAGGAQKIYWTCKRNGQESVIAVDQFTLDFAAGRVVGDQSFVLQFKAIYPTSAQTQDIPVTIKETIPDPAFTLSAPVAWDGRQTITVTPRVSNRSALQAAGATNLNYHWSVAGIAVTKQITPGMLTLLRSQGSGPMTVTLVLDNGGALVTNTATIAVKEPATDPWVVRQPEADEKPMHGQFYARDNTGFGTVYYNGTLSNAPNTVFLNLYADGVLYTNLSQTVSGSAYAFSARLASGLVKYSVQFGSVRGGVTNVFDTVTNLVCGDAYLIDGQSNAVADNNNPPYAAYTSDWIRSYGNMTGGTNSGWGNAVVSTAHGDAYRIGYWGMVLASNLVASCNIPICIINGAVGGTRVDQHQRNESNPEDGDTIYGRILTRVKGARLTHGIRGVLWHQGENNSGAAAPTGDWDYKSYQQYFVDMSAAWKQDYPNLLHYYVYQVWPLPCGMGPKGDQVREAQRTLPRFYSNMRIMSTVGMATRPEWARGLCHFDWDGYVMFADLMAPLVKRDNYGFIPTSVITAPDLKKAYFTSARQDEIALEFGQAMEAPGKTNATANFYLDLVPNLVTAISVRDNVVKLQLLGPATAQTIAYLADRDWDGNQAHLLRGANRIAALTFCEVPILRAAGAQPAGEKQR